MRAPASTRTRCSTGPHLPGRARLATLAAAAAALAGCGAEEQVARTPRPPAPVTVTASIGADRVAVSPRTLGAGPIQVVVTNQTDAAQELTLAGADPPVRVRTAPISPSGTATLQVEVAEGAYRLAAAGAGIRAARLRVGAPRRSAQGDLLLP